MVVVLKKGDLTEEEAEKMGDGETWKDADESGTGDYSILLPTCHKYLLHQGL